MNRFEKKALAKRAYRALIKRAETYESPTPDYDAGRSGANLWNTMPMHGITTGFNAGHWDPERESLQRAPVGSTPRTAYQQFLNSSYNGTRDVVTAFGNMLKKMRNSNPKPPADAKNVSGVDWQLPQLAIGNYLKGGLDRFNLPEGYRSPGHTELPKINLPPAGQKPLPPISYPVFKKDVTPRLIPTDKVENPYRYPDGRPMPQYHYPQNGETFDL